MVRPLSIIIVGGGVAGLCAAIALERQGMTAAIYEREPVIRPVGAGLCLWHNAAMALDFLGLTEQLQTVSTPFFKQENRNSSGQIIESHSFTELSERLHAQAMTIHRGDLHDVLLANVKHENVHLGERCTGFQSSGEGVTVEFENGRSVSADCLVGAEGIWSVVRQGLHGDERARYAGYVCFRGMVEYDPTWFPMGSFVQSIGDGARFGVVHSGKNQAYWWATINAPENTTVAPDQRKRLLLDRYRDWAAPVPQVIEATPDMAILLNDIIDRPPIGAWGTGPVTLAGDAAHPMTPNMAQGACQAIEDGVVLANFLAQAQQGLALSDALRAYEQARAARTAMVVNVSWLIGARGQGLIGPEVEERPVTLADRERLLTFNPQTGRPTATQ